MAPPSPASADTVAFDTPPSVPAPTILGYGGYPDASSPSSPAHPSPSSSEATGVAWLGVGAAGGGGPAIGIGCGGGGTEEGLEKGEMRLNLFDRGPVAGTCDVAHEHAENYFPVQDS